MKESLADSVSVIVWDSTIGLTSESHWHSAFARAYRFRFESHWMFETDSTSVFHLVTASDSMMQCGKQSASH